jgi:hypothetical protein
VNIIAQDGGALATKSGVSAAAARSQLVSVQLVAPG